MILDAVRESDGLALATSEADIPNWMRLVCAKEGLAICPETAVCFAALEVLLKRGVIKPDSRILIFNTGAAQKYPEAITAQLSRIDINKPIEWSKL
jgi:threonine synthase